MVFQQSTTFNNQITMLINMPLVVSLMFFYTTFVCLQKYVFLFSVNTKTWLFFLIFLYITSKNVFFLKTRVFLPTQSGFFLALHDKDSSIFSTTTTLIVLFLTTQIFSYIRFLNKKEVFFTRLFFFIANMLCILFTRSWFFFLFLWEALGVFSISLIGFFCQKNTTIKTTLKVFFFNKLSDFFLTLAVLFFFKTNACFFFSTQLIFFFFEKQ